jgi:Tol biopolymer transport system component/predicted Ser/Thr protein kinase
MIGRTLSHFKLVARLGAGGMGEVYLAEDTSLGRRVALKVLPVGLADRPESLRRLELEAKALAALDHPNIVTIYSIEEVEGIRFLTMAYVEGRTLDEVISAGGLSLKRLLKLAIPLAAALKAAHEQGIIHRDLKPGNVMVDGEDRLRVLDFGLAKHAMRTDLPENSELPTEVITEAGMILGTYPSMSPEQAEGKTVDHRSDIFSLGVMLYEMATGQRPFHGETPTSLVSSILRDVPRPVIEWRGDLPRQLGRIVGRCLEKNPERRAQSALDVHNELVALKEEVESVASALPTTPAPAVPARPWVRWGLAVVAAAAAAGLVWALLGRDGEAPARGVSASTIRPITNFIGWEWSPSWSPDGTMLTYSHAVGGDADVAVLSRGGGEPHLLTAASPADELNPAWSPDGTKIAFISDRGTGTNVYWIPPTGGAERKVAETNIPSLERMGAWAWALGTNPWSPDGRELLFSRMDESGDVALWKVALETGEQTRLTSPLPGGEDLAASWSFDGASIVFVRHLAGVNTLSLLPAEDGKISAIAEVGPINAMPAWFPDSRRLAFTSVQGGAPNIWEMDLESGEQRQLTFGGGIDWCPVVARDGSIAYVQFGHQIDIYWSPLDAPEAEAQRLTTFTGGNFGARVSPEGDLVLYNSNRAGNFDLWLLDRVTGQHRPLTQGPANDRLSDWSADGQEVVFMSDRGGMAGLWVVGLESGAIRQLTDHALPWSNHSAEGQGGPRWAPDGSVIGYLAPEEDNAIWLIDPDGENRRASTVHGALSFGWYRDGQRAVYTRRATDGSGLVELRVADLESGEDRLLRTGAIAEVAVARDGSALSFIEAVSHFTMELYVLRLAPPSAPGGLPTADGEPQQVTFGNGQWHVHSGGWAPDGSAVVYSRDADEGNILVIETEKAS